SSLSFRPWPHAIELMGMRAVIEFTQLSFPSMRFRAATGDVRLKMGARRGEQRITRLSARIQWQLSFPSVR
ncbi:hypothetical protein PENTCL1PPCAC_13272, partial [Pristionchus entomophagus]